MYPSRQPYPRPHPDTEPWARAASALCSRLGLLRQVPIPLGLWGDRAGSVPARGDSPGTCDGAKSPEGAGGLAPLGPVPALSRGHRPGLVPQLYNSGMALGQQQLLCKDCLCCFGMCCLYSTGGGKGHGCSVPVVAALPAAPGMHVCWEQLPSLGLGLGLPAMEA